MVLALPAEAELRTIQGRQADSQGEAWIATALDRLGHRYIYQYRILDIPNVAGAFEIDFLVLSTVPFSTPLEFFGEYWHEGRMGADDRLRLSLIEQHFRGRANEVIVIWGREAQTEEDVQDVVLKKVGPA